MKKYFILFFLSKSLFSGDFSLVALEKEKSGLISIYYERINEALEKRLIDRAILLEETLFCFKDSKSKRDISACKENERRKILSYIR